MIISLYPTRDATFNYFDFYETINNLQFFNTRFLANPSAWIKELFRHILDTSFWKLRHINDGL